MAVKGKSHFTMKRPLYPDYEVIATQELFDPEYGCEYKFGFVTFVYMKSSHIVGTEILSGISRKLDEELLREQFDRWKKRAIEDGKV